MTKVTGRVRLRLVKPFNVKTDKKFAKVFAPISIHPSQYYTYTFGISKTEITQTECECMPRKYSVPFIYHPENLVDVSS